MDILSGWGCTILETVIWNILHLISVRFHQINADLVNHHFGLLTNVFSPSWRDRLLILIALQMCMTSILSRSPERRIRVKPSEPHPVEKKHLLPKCLEATPALCLLLLEIHNSIRLVSWKDAMTLCTLSLFLVLQTWGMGHGEFLSYQLVYIDVICLGSACSPYQQIALSTFFIRKDAFRAEKQSLWHTTGLTDLDELFYFNVPPINVCHQRLELLIPAVLTHKTYSLSLHFSISLDHTLFPAVAIWLSSLSLLKLCFKSPPI